MFSLMGTCYYSPLILEELLNISQDDPDLERASNKELCLTGPVLTRVFRGSLRKLLPILLKVRSCLEIEHPDYFSQRITGNNNQIITVVTTEGREAFIQEMMKGGIELQDKKIIKLENTDLPLTDSGLSPLFKGDWKVLFPIVKKIEVQMKSEHPECLVQRKNGHHIIDAVIAEGREMFIQTMMVAGAKLKPQYQNAIEEIQDSDFPITQSSLEKTFIGGYYGLLQKVQEFKNISGLEHPEYFKRRISSNHKFTLEVITSEGRQAFFEAMITAGAQLHDRTIQDLKGTDLPLTHAGWNIFIGGYYKNKALAQQVIPRLESEYPEYFCNRINNGRLIRVINEEGKKTFIDAMMDAGAKLKE